MFRAAAITLLVLFHLTQVHSQKTDSLGMGKELDQVVITAQFTPTDTRQTVNSVKILNRKTIEQRSLVSLQELLQTETNIRVAQDPILGSVLSINALRGENIKILVDGVPIVGRLNGNVDAGQIPLNAIQKVEIIEGAQSLLYGSDASGGVINIITKKSQVKKIDAEVAGQYESNGFRQVTGRLGYASKKWIMQLSGNVQDFVPATDTTMGRDQLWNPKKQRSGRGLIRFMPSDRTDFRLTTNILTESVDNLGDKKRPQFRPYAFDDFFYTDRLDLSLHGEHWTKKKNLIQGTVAWNTFQRIKNSYRYDFDNNINELLVGMQDTSTAQGVLSRFTFASDQKSRKWNYMLGLENYYEFAIGTRLADTTLNEKGKAYTNDLGIFASGKIQILSQLTLQTGARATYNLRYGSAITPSTWLHWSPNLPLQWRFSWAYGFRSPAIKELFFSFIDINHFVTGNPNLKPEKSVNLRSEITWDIVKSKASTLTLTQTSFLNNVQDRIILTALGPVHYEYQNVDVWKTLGGGIKLAYQYEDWLKIQSEVITTGFNNTNDNVEVEKGALLWSTDWSNDVTVSFMKNRLHWNIWHKRTGKTPFFYNQDGKTQQGATDTWNMLNSGLSAQLFKNKVRLNAGVKNIFDIRQLQVNNNNGIHIEASNQQNLHWGRSVYAGVTFQW